MLILPRFKLGATSSSKAAIFLCALLWQQVLLAGDGDSLFKLTGFGTLGLTHAGNDEFGYHRDYSQKGQFGDWKLSTDSAFGLQLNADLNDALDTVVQVVAKSRLNNTFDRSLEWAFLRYKVTPNLNIRAGRMAIDLYNLSEYRQVGFAYLWARPISEFYTPVPVGSLDGFDVQFSTRLGPGILHSKLFIGSATDIVDTPFRSFEFTLAPIYGVNLRYETGAWKSRITLATSEIDDIDDPLSDLVSALQTVPVFVWPNIDRVLDRFQTEGARLSYYSAGLTYDRDDWIGQAEFAVVDSEYLAAPSNKAGYLSIGNRITEDITAYITYSKVETSNDAVQLPPPISFDIPGVKELYDGATTALNSSRLDQNSVSVGMRWNLTTNLALKLQWDHTRIGKNGSGLWASQSLTLNEKETLDTFTINFDFIF